MLTGENFLEQVPKRNGPKGEAQLTREMVGQSMPPSSLGLFLAILKRLAMIPCQSEVRGLDLVQ